MIKKARIMKKKKGWVKLRRKSKKIKMKKDKLFNKNKIKLTILATITIRMT